VTDARYSVGGEVICRVASQGLDAGEVYTVEAVRRQRTTAGTVITLTVRAGQQLVEVPNPAGVLQRTRIEAYGVKGLQSRPWRRIFADAEKLDAWCERQNAVVYGQRYVEGG
jgi:hypothetical protein